MHIIIGAETEYGIFCRSEKHGYITEDFSLAAEVVGSIEYLHPVFKRPLEGIKNEKEHRMAELGLFKKMADLLRKPISAAMAQRYGMSGMVLSNGARFYVDCKHPEYSIPETSNPKDALIAQKAGDFIVNECRKKAEDVLRSEKSPLFARRLQHPTLEIRIDRTNSDGKKSSYAVHENYSVSPQVFRRLLRRAFRPGGDLSPVFMTFLAARQIIAGAGKVGFESGKPVPFQISARADFIEREINSSTIDFRPIINTRDIPYADGRFIRRLHVICGDSNMSQLSLFLKFGLTALFLMMLEDGFLERNESVFNRPLSDPVRSYRNVSRDLTLKHEMFFAGGVKKTALEVMAETSELMDKFVSEKALSKVWLEVAEKFKGVINGFYGNRHQNEFSRNLDWVVKERLLEDLVRRKNIGWDHHECFALNLRYHNIDPDSKISVFHRLEKKGEIARIVSENEIKGAVLSPPNDTRASLRGYLAANHPASIESIGWSYVLFKDGTLVNLDDPRGFDVFSVARDRGSLGLLRQVIDVCRRGLSDAR